MPIAAAPANRANKPRRDGELIVSWSRSLIWSSIMFGPTSCLVFHHAVVVAFIFLHTFRARPAGLPAAFARPPAVGPETISLSCRRPGRNAADIRSPGPIDPANHA